MTSAHSPNSAEELTKPELTRIISEGQGKAFAADTVARMVLRGIKRGNFQVCNYRAKGFGALGHIFGLRAVVSKSTARTVA